MDRSAYTRFWELEQAHFWRVSKRRLLLELIDRHAPPLGERPRRLLDVGGACSILSQELARFGNVTIVEPDEPTAAFAKEQFGLDVRVGQLPDQLPVDGLFDVITLFDVIEHVEDDLAGLRAVRELLRPGGLLVVTVPALMLLWSDHDVANHHFRRYDKRQLSALIERAGFSVDRLTYFTSLLFPFVALQRLAGRLRRPKENPEYDVKTPRAPVNQALRGVMSIERSLLRRIDMPIGSSLVAICGLR
jgi:SAM-dependent methyltransferase